MQLFHVSSPDGGRSWGEIRQVFNNNTDYLAFPSLTTNGDTLFLACVLRETYLFFRSFDAGQTWQDSIVIDQDSLFVIIQYPELLYSDGILHFVYPLSIVGESLGIEVYYRRSTDLGLNWSDRIILSPAEPFPNHRHSQIPSAYADSNGRILVAWMDYSNGSMCGISGDIFYRVSLDNGDTWQPWGSITNTQSGEGSFSLILGDKFHVAWADNWLLGCGHPKETYSISSDSGWSWEPPEFTSGPDVATEGAPRLAYTIQGADTVLHCFYWKHTENSGGSLFYIRNPDFVSAVNGTDMPLPNTFHFVAYPNPFNAQTSFSFSIPNEDGCLDIFNVQGQLVKRIQLRGKQGNITWDSRNMEGDDVSSGIYYVTLKSGEFEKAIQITLLR